MSGVWKVPDASSSASASTSANQGPPTLADIMSEQLAGELQAEEELLAQEPKPQTTDEPWFESEADCQNDIMMAKLLQHEFDREYDVELRRQAAKLNGANKVTVSYEKYVASHPLEDSESSEEDEDLRETDTYKLYNKQSPVFGPSGLLRQSDGSVVSKHDKVIAGRKNTSKVLQFPPEFLTGDAAGDDVQLSNRVFNELKTHSKGESKRQHRVHDKAEKATAELAMDSNTRLILFKMVNAGMLDSITGSVATGKESIVFHAYGGSLEHKQVPSECAIKVFKTTLSQFKNRSEYVKDDYRFKNPRKLLKIWAEKEMLNLNRMGRNGIRCPEVVKLKKHVLVMSFIGGEGRSAPKLKEVQLPEEELLVAYNECVAMMTRMYQHCSLVHADLSEFNILYWREHCWFIDVSQAVDTSHPKSLVFLARDCKNLTEFFQKHGLESIQSTRELFNSVTSMNIDSDESFLTEVQRFAVENRATVFRKDKSNPADCLLRKVQQESGGDDFGD